MSQVQQLPFLHRLACLAAIGTMLVGMVVMFGWLHDLPTLYQGAPGLPAMTPHEALSFILLGGTLFLLQPPTMSGWRRLAGLLLACGGFVLGVLMLLEYLHVLPDVGVDRWLLSLDTFSLLSLHMSPQTALAFCLTSIGLFFLGLERLNLTNLAQWAALVSVMALVAVFLGFAHQEDLFATLFGVEGMSLLTASAFTLLGWGIILAKVELGFLRIMANDSAGGEVARQVMFLMALFPPALGWLPVLLHTEQLTHTEVESLLATVMVLAIMIIVIRLAYRLDHHALLREQAEATARQHQADLAHMVRLNTMGEMASGIAHELNQPLAAVSNYAGACQRMIHAGQDAERLLEPLESIQKQARRASEIIRRLRSFVRKQQPQKIQACLEQVIHEAMLLTKTNTLKHNIPLLLELDDAVPDIKMDVIQIEQVVLNIAQNAIDAMRDTDSHRRQILVRSYLNPQGMVQVDISDTGPGMDAELKQQVFDAFVTTKGQGGMGIGLSLCRSIIEAHGGHLWVESEPGQGATFSFTLPPH